MFLIVCHTQKFSFIVSAQIQLIFLNKLIVLILFNVKIEDNLLVFMYVTFFPLFFHTWYGNK